MFKKILIANRGEIAVRVIRCCRELGIPTVGVFSDVDRASLHVILADEAYNIGPAPSTESYLNIPKILEAIERSEADAVHPGYGFLSENAAFARALEERNITFIGPTSKNIEQMGDKLAARELMKKAGVPIVPGSPGALRDLREAQIVAAEIGYPIIIKAAAGGGGKGMRVCYKPEDLESAFRAAQSEGFKFFKNDTVYMERFISNPKHIEVQVFGDKHGNIVHLYERECSVQRRHQKIIEESPSPSVPAEVREKLGKVAVQAAKAIHYLGAGTFEFIFDNTTKEFFFMEMNTRLQVEHPVTESVTGYDLVREQIRVAAGKELSFKQSDVEQNGHAIEARICAEDPTTFMPSPGKLRRFRPPQGPFVRVDSYAYSGYRIPIYYDPMIAKLITWGANREEAIRRMKRALSEFSIAGIKSNINLHKAILDHPRFLDGSYTTQFAEKDVDLNIPTLFRYVEDDVFLITAAIAAYNDRKIKNVTDYNVASHWKNLGRQSALRN